MDMIVDRSTDTSTVHSNCYILYISLYTKYDSQNSVIGAVDVAV